jgi:hypothetical protein
MEIPQALSFSCGREKGGIAIFLNLLKVTGIATPANAGVQTLPRGKPGTI